MNVSFVRAGGHRRCTTRSPRCVCRVQNVRPAHPQWLLQAAAECCSCNCEHRPSRRFGGASQPQSVRRQRATVHVPMAHVLCRPALSPIKQSSHQGQPRAAPDVPGRGRAAHPLPMGWGNQHKRVAKTGPAPAVASICSSSSVAIGTTRGEKSWIYMNLRKPAAPVSAARDLWHKGNQGRRDD